MGWFTSVIYQGLVKVYQTLPFKKQICDLIRVWGIPHDKFYKEIKFRGKFKVSVEGESIYLIHHYNSTLENEIYWKGLGTGWEKETIGLWLELCKQSKVVFDVGANTGVYGLAARAVNKHAKIVSFEPSRRMFSKLMDNINLNNFDIVGENIALSDKTGEQIFYDEKADHQYSASLNPAKLKELSGYSGEIDEYIVQTQSLMDYIVENGIQGIDLMKIDVELHEPEVIEGFGSYLNQFRPTIFIEILTEDIANRLNELFRDSTYLFYSLPANSKPIKVSELSAGVEGNWNYLICEQSIVDQLKL